jgi:hypothetical protein
MKNVNHWVTTARCKGAARALLYLFVVKLKKMELVGFHQQ